MYQETGGSPEVSFQEKSELAHEALIQAHKNLIERLEDYGNKSSRGQKKSLLGLMGLFNDMALGLNRGRFAYPLPTGYGKTLSVILWSAQLYKSGIKDISVALCASKVEELCNIKRQMVSEGLPDDSIGLLHSYQYNDGNARKYLEGHERLPEGFASLPATRDNEDKQILLATHNRVRENEDIEQYGLYKGKKRNLVIWDESFFTSEPHIFNKLQLERAIGSFEPLQNIRYGGSDFVDDFKEFLSAADEEYMKQLAEKKSPSAIHFSELTEAQIEDLKSDMGNDINLAILKRFLNVSHKQFRVLDSSDPYNTGIMTYERKVPKELENIVVLDASYDIRRLSGASLVYIAEAHPSMYNHWEAKVRYHNVTIHQLPHGSGRETITGIQSNKKREDRLVSKEVAEVVKGIPEDEGIIIFNFKKRLSDKVDYTDVMKKDFEALGIDTSATIEVNGQEKPRFVWLTWGQETAVSHFSYCSNVICAGVLHRSLLDVAGTEIAERNDLTSELWDSEIGALKKSEIAHCLYQAISRSSSRIIVNGIAKKTNVWLIHRNKIRDLMEEVMPWVTFVPWKPRYLGQQKTTKTKQLSDSIFGFLGDYEGVRISVQKLKKKLGMTEIPKRSFSRALDMALELLPEWAKEKQSVVRQGADDLFP